MQYSRSRGKQNIGKAHISLAQQLIEQLEQCIRDFREAQRFSGVVLLVVVGGGGGGRFLHDDQESYTPVYTVSVVSVCPLRLIFPLM